MSRNYDKLVQMAAELNEAVQALQDDPEAFVREMPEMTGKGLGARSTPDRVLDDIGQSSSWLSAYMGSYSSPVGRMFVSDREKIANKRVQAVRKAQGYNE